MESTRRARPAQSPRLPRDARFLIALLVVAAILAPVPVRAQQADPAPAGGLFIIRSADDEDGESKPDTVVAPTTPESEPEPPVTPSVESLLHKEMAVDSCIVRHPGPWFPSTRKQRRPPALWRHYSHGVIDYFAEHVGWSELLGDGQNGRRLLDPKATIETPFKQSMLPALKLGPKSAIECKKPLRINMVEAGGRALRVFVWMKGKGVGDAGDSWGSPPGMALMLRDAGGKVLRHVPAHMKTQGTFPWHCYYADVTLPGRRPVAAADADKDSDAVAAGAACSVYLAFSNPQAGTAWFSTVSWEWVDVANTYSDAEKQDPFTGSMAFNASYDELPHHLRWGRGMRHKWLFLTGDKRRVPGQAYNVTTADGIRAYYSGKARKNMLHMQYAIPLLGAWYHCGKEHDLLPPFEQDWAAAFAKVLIQAQDEETGLWGTADVPRSMAVTWRIVDGLFGSPRIPREDCDDRLTPWLTLGAKEIPRAERIIATVLGMQSTYRTKSGRSANAAWNLESYHFKSSSRRSQQAASRCSLASTSNAIGLMRMASRHGSSGLRARVYDSVQDALKHVLDECVTRSWLWKQNDTDKAPTTDAYLPQIIERSAYLERRIRPLFGGPRLEASPVKKGAFTVAWQSPADPFVSARIYAVPKDAAAGTATEEHLIGIIQRPARKLTQMDPFIAVETLRHASRTRWGTAWNFMGENTYTTSKLSMLKTPLALSIDAKPLPLTVKGIARLDLYVSGVTWYGEECRLAPVPLVIEEPEEEELVEDGDEDGDEGEDEDQDEGEDEDGDEGEDQDEDEDGEKAEGEGDADADGDDTADAEGTPPEDPEPETEPGTGSPDADGPAEGDAPPDDE